MSEGPTIGDWTQYGWIPDEVSSFSARVRLRNAAWMVYYEPDTVVQRERAERLELQSENAKLREFVADLMAYLKEAERVHGDSLIPDLYYDRARELGVEVKQ